MTEFPTMIAILARATAGPVPTWTIGALSFVVTTALILTGQATALA